jgi:hypothetical protein
MRTSNEEIEEMSQLPLDKSEDHQSDSNSTF